MANRPKLLVPVGAVLIAGAAFVAYGMPVIKARAKEQSEIEVPAGRLARAQKDSPKLMEGVIEVDPRTPSVDDPIFAYRVTKLDLAANFGNDLDTTANALARDPAFREEVKRVAQHPLPASQEFVTRDILFERPYRTTRAVARAMVEFGFENQQKGDLSAALSSYQEATTFTKSISGINEGPSVVTYVGIANDINRRLYDVIVSPNVTVQQLDQITAFLDNSPDSGDIKQSFRRQIQECVLAARNIDSFDFGEIRTINSEDRNVGPPVKHPNIKEAMETKLIETWEKADKSASDQPTNEKGGIAIDEVLRTAFEDKTDGNYMVRTLGTVFEQIGRNMTRVAQARQALVCLAYVRKSQLTTGKVPATLPAELTSVTKGDDKFTIEYTPTSKGCTIVSQSYDPSKSPRITNGFQIDQLAGVYIYY